MLSLAVQHHLSDAKPSALFSAFVGALVAMNVVNILNINLLFLSSSSKNKTTLSTNVVYKMTYCE